MKRLFALASLAILAIAAPALAAPIPYVTAPLDTINATVNAAIANMNSSLPTAAVYQSATASAGAATLNGLRGAVTSESLTTAAGSDYVLTLTDASVNASSQVFVSVANGTNTTEGIAVNRVQASAGSVVIHVRNTHASSALNGTIVVNFLVVN